MVKADELPVTKRVILEQFNIARKKRKAAEVRLRNAKKLEDDLLSILKEIGYYEGDVTNQ